MLEVLVRIVCVIIMSITIFYILRKVLPQTETKINIRIIVGFLILIVLSVLVYQIQYTMIYSLTTYLINIIIFKEIFKTSLEKSTICITIAMVILLFADMFTSFIMRGFFDINQIRKSYILTIVANVSVAFISIAFVSIKKIYTQLQQFALTLSTKKTITNLVFFVLLIIDLSC